uniref:Non-specific lipid transfer protein GPI-anchored 1 isoform X2 n=1 Tax=Elaeis guineensis var. tenera TaxID=51953 RepID=A0A6J0PKR3_ELAGV|nr:non-specific lipid transfer protein GPI-anchored 1 isoform X2 [Elaeis guineensis]
MEGGIQSVLLSCLLLSLLVVASSDDSSLQSKCAPEFQKLTGCLDFAAAKTDTPTSQCCSSVTDIRNKDAACLCYIIQQTHAGSSTIKSLGLQFDRLLQLPQACKLANASVSDCPTNSASTNATPTSGVVMHQNCFDGTFTIAVVSAIYLSIFGIWA